jgi:branched-chain amino acid transport system permease protein
MNRGGKNRVVRRDIALGAAAVAAAIVIPFLDPGRYVLTQVTLFFIWAMVVTQWNLVFGVAGIFSLAQMAVFAFGAYSTAMLGLYLGLNLWVGGLVGAFVALIFSTLVGVATLRSRGPYVALLTLAIAVVMYQLIVSDTACFYYEGTTCYSFTGGQRSLSRFGTFGFREIFGYNYQFHAAYAVALVLLILGTVFAFVIIRSPLGHAFRALRDNEQYAKTRGINRVKYQLLVFALSGFFTGLAGAFYAGNFKVIGPNILDLSLLLFLVSMMVVGGLGRAWGPLMGSATLMLADEVLRDYPEWRLVGLGAITIVFIILLRGGLVGAIEGVSREIKKQFAAAP